MKIVVTSFRRSHASTATLSAPNPAAGHHQPMPPPETRGHSWASLGQSLVGSLLLSPGSWCAQGSVCALQESISPVLCKFWQALWWGYWPPPPRGLMPYPSLLHPELLPLRQATADPYPTELLKHSSVSVSVGSLGPGAQKVKVGLPLWLSQ